MSLPRGGLKKEISLTPLTLDRGKDHFAEPSPHGSGALTARTYSEHEREMSTIQRLRRSQLRDRAKRRIEEQEEVLRMELYQKYWPICKHNVNVATSEEGLDERVQQRLKEVEIRKLHRKVELEVERSRVQQGDHEAMVRKMVSDLLREDEAAGLGPAHNNGWGVGPSRWEPKTTGKWSTYGDSPSSVSMMKHDGPKGSQLVRMGTMAPHMAPSPKDIAGSPEQIRAANNQRRQSTVLPRIRGLKSLSSDDQWSLMQGIPKGGETDWLDDWLKKAEAVRLARLAEEEAEEERNRQRAEAKRVTYAQAQAKRNKAKMRRTTMLGGKMGMSKKANAGRVSAGRGRGGGRGRTYHRDMVDADSSDEDLEMAIDIAPDPLGAPVINQEAASNINEFSSRKQIQHHYHQKVANTFKKKARGKDMDGALRKIATEGKAVMFQEEPQKPLSGFRRKFQRASKMVMNAGAVRRSSGGDEGPVPRLGVPGHPAAALGLAGAPEPSEEELARQAQYLDQMDARFNWEDPESWSQVESYRSYLVRPLDSKLANEKSLGVVEKMRRIERWVYGDALNLSPIMAVSGGGIPEDTSEIVFESFTRHPEVSKVVLSRSTLNDSGAAALIAVLHRCAENITSLDLSHNCLSWRAMQTVANQLIQCNAEIRETDLEFKMLDFSGNTIGDRGVAELARGLTENGTVTALDISRCGMKDAGARVLGTMLEGNIGLKYLTLKWNMVGPSGAGMIAQALKTNMHLTHLDISSVGLGDKGCTALAEALCENVPLVQVNLADNLIDAAQAIMLAVSFTECASLTAVDMSSNPVRLEGATRLLQLPVWTPRIRHIDLTACRLESAVSLKPPPPPPEYDEEGRLIEPVLKAPQTFAESWERTGAAFDVRAPEGGYKLDLQRCAHREVLLQLMRVSQEGGAFALHDVKLNGKPWTVPDEAQWGELPDRGVCTVVCVAGPVDAEAWPALPPLAADQEPFIFDNLGQKGGAGDTWQMQYLEALSHTPGLFFTTVQVYRLMAPLVYRDSRCRAICLLMNRVDNLEELYQTMTPLLSLHELLALCRAAGLLHLMHPSSPTRRYRLDLTQLQHRLVLCMLAGDYSMQMHAHLCGGQKVVWRNCTLDGVRWRPTPSILASLASRPATGASRKGSPQPPGSPGASGSSAVSSVFAQSWGSGPWSELGALAGKNLIKYRIPRKGVVQVDYVSFRRHLDGDPENPKMLPSKGLTALVAALDRSVLGLRPADHMHLMATILDSPKYNTHVRPGWATPRTQSGRVSTAEKPATAAMEDLYRAAAKDGRGVLGTNRHASGDLEESSAAEGTSWAAAPEPWLYPTILWDELNGYLEHHLGLDVSELRKDEEVEQHLDASARLVGTPTAEEFDVRDFESGELIMEPATEAIDVYYVLRGNVQMVVQAERLPPLEETEKKGKKGKGKEAKKDKVKEAAEDEEEEADGDPAAPADPYTCVKPAGPGEFLGLLHFLASSGRGAYVAGCRAYTRCRLLVLKRAAINRLLFDCQAVKLAVVNAARKRQKQLDMLKNRMLQKFAADLHLSMDIPAFPTLVADIEVRRYRAGDVILRPGDRNLAIGFLLRGAVHMTTRIAVEKTTFQRRVESQDGRRGSTGGEEAEAAAAMATPRGTGGLPEVEVQSRRIGPSPTAYVPDFSTFLVDDLVQARYQAAEECEVMIVYKADFLHTFAQQPTALRYVLQACKHAPVCLPDPEDAGTEPAPAPRPPAAAFAFPGSRPQTSMPPGAAGPTTTPRPPSNSRPLTSVSPLSSTLKPARALRKYEAPVHAPYWCAPEGGLLPLVHALASHYCLRCSDLVHLLSALGLASPLTRIEAVVALWPHLVDRAEQFSAVLEVLGPAEQMAVRSRLGPLQTWDPKRPTGWYSLSLDLPDERRCLQKIDTLISDIEGARWEELRVNDQPVKMSKFGTGSLMEINVQLAAYYGWSEEEAAANLEKGKVRLQGRLVIPKPEALTMHMAQRIVQAARMRFFMDSRLGRLRRELKGRYSGHGGGDEGSAAGRSSKGPRAASFRGSKAPAAATAKDQPVAKEAPNDPEKAPEGGASAEAA